MDREIRLSEFFNVRPENLFSDWLASKAHSAFTESPAAIDPIPGGKFTAWDGYITGTTKEIEEGRRIIQNWRTTEFSDMEPDSILEITFEPEGAGTRLSLTHSQIPDGQADGYEAGWRDYYFEPMKKYYS
jgi:activator of HSP90 ATPase